MSIDGNNNIGGNNFKKDIPEAHLVYGIQVPKESDEEPIIKFPGKNGDEPKIHAVYGIQIGGCNGDDPIFKFPEEGENPNIHALYGIALPNEPIDKELPRIPKNIPDLNDEQKTELKSLLERIMEILTSKNETTEDKKEEE